MKVGDRVQLIGEASWGVGTLTKDLGSRTFKHRNIVYGPHHYYEVHWDDHPSAIGHYTTKELELATQANRFESIEIQKVNPHLIPPKG